MPLKILADESVDHRIVRKLRRERFDIISVTELYKGVSDRKVLQMSVEVGAVLLTEDRDFGEWIFAHHEIAIGVVYLRYNVKDIDKIMGSLIKVLDEKDQNLFGKFIVVTIKKIRIREITLH